MIRPIIRDIIFLQQKSTPADSGDLIVADDLRDTLQAHADGCVGMAANMIGVSRRIIVFEDEGTMREMFNPVILKRTEPYEAQEGCLSLDGTRSAKRWKNIWVQWQNRAFQTRTKRFSGFSAQIIQHELDHCDGILI